MKTINYFNTIDLDEIIIHGSFVKHSPNKNKINKAIKYLKKYKHIDKPVVLNNNVLVDGYTRYLAAYTLGIQKIPYVELQHMNYIVGKFDNCDKKYIWKNDLGINTSKGDKVLVSVKINNKNKLVCVNVVDTFSSNSLSLYNKHKSVIQKCINNK